MAESYTTQAIRRMKARRISFALRLSLLGTLLITLSVALCAWFAYQYRYDELKNSVAHELLAVVNSAAAAIDGDEHSVIGLNEKDEIGGFPEFRSIRAHLQEVKRRNNLTGHGSPIYTMRRAADFAERKELEFVVMTDPDKNGVWFVGARYQALPHLLSALAGYPATTGLYADDEGMWISAAAPILNHAGTVVGLLQADRHVDYLVTEARRSAWRTMSIALLCSAIGWVLTWIYSRTLVRPITRLADATRQLSQGKLRIDVPLDRNDELGDLARDFNKMALQLEAAHERDAAQLEHIQATHEALERANRNLEETNARLELESQRAHELAKAATAASKAKSEFLATVSHELRTPLNGVLGFSELLRSTPLTQDQIDLASQIHQSGNSLLIIINDILDFAKFDSGQVTLDAAPMNLRCLAGEVAQLLAVEALGKGLKLTVDPSGFPSQPVIGDPARVRHVLLNLVGNAVKFTEAGGVMVRCEELEAAVGAPAARVRISVTDTGIGIAPDRHESLFKEFTQLDASTTRKYGGTGLGLALCKKLVPLMGGEIGFSSEPGKGSTFWFTLPTPKPVTEASAGGSHGNPEANTAGLSEAREAPSSDTPRARSSPTGTELRVLVVEDNTINQRLATRILESLQCRVSLAKNGREAVEMAGIDTYDCIFMDCQMPVMDGYEATHAIRELEKSRRLARTPIIALTANTLPEDRKHCMDSGMDGFVSKPISRDQIREALDQMVIPAEGLLRNRACDPPRPKVQGESAKRP